MPVGGKLGVALEPYVVLHSSDHSFCSIADLSLGWKILVLSKVEPGLFLLMLNKKYWVGLI